MPASVAEFFDSLAPVWDDRADDDLTRVSQLFKRLDIQNGDKVLDLACGTGVVTGLIHRFSCTPVHGLDISIEMIARAKAKYARDDYASFEQGDFLSWKGGRYDYIVIYNAYPHFVDVAAFKNALLEHLVPGGRFAIVHSIGRAKLAQHHHNLSANISRNIDAPKEEAVAYQDCFDIFLAEEGEDFYLLAGRLSNKEQNTVLPKNK